MKKFMLEIVTVIENLTSDLNTEIIDVTPNHLHEFYNSTRHMQKAFQKREQFYSEIFSILNSAAVNIELDKFLDDFVPKLINSTNSNCGAFYLLNNFTNKLEIKYSNGFSKNIYKEFDIDLNEGFMPNSKEVKIIRDVPVDTMYIMKTFLGKIKPKSIMTIPVFNETEDQMIGVLVLSSIYNYTEEHVEIINLTKHYIGIAVNNGIIFERSQRLTNELKFQNKLIQDLNEELEAKIKCL